jgi:hypothetical protein
MSDRSTIAMLEMFRDSAPAPMFLTQMTSMPPGNIHSQEKVSVDIVREDGDIAVVRTNPLDSANVNTDAKYVSKDYTPTVIKESIPITVYNSTGRQPGANPFEDAETAFKITQVALGHVNRLVNKAARTVELMTAQVFQTASITLTDADSNTRYSVDFEGKDTHFAHTTDTWELDGTDGDPLGDLANMIMLVREDGRVNPNRLIFGSEALVRFLANPVVQKQFEKQAFNTAALNPGREVDGGYYIGQIFISGQPLEIWLYNQTYKDPATGTATPYLGINNVIITSTNTRIDATYGNIPRIAPPDPRAAAIFPPNLSAPRSRLAVWVNPWITPNNESVMFDIGTRPLVIPTQIDGFACLTVVQA